MTAAATTPAADGVGTDSWGFARDELITADLAAVRLLGGGAAYEAYLAFDEITYSPVVVKVLRPSQVEDDSARRGLVREVRALGAINHPGVVRGLRHTVEGERPHVVLECVDGPRLSTLIRRYGPLQEQQYLPLAVDVAAVLHYLDRLGYAHLDIKPSNVIMGAPARLIDLSVARTVGEAAVLRSLIGTDAYMAPEQCDPGGRYGVPGPASDVWGLGATLFEAVTGQRRFADLDRHVSPPPVPDRVPLPVRTVIEAMLEPQPGNRPRPAEISESLSPVLAALPRGHLAGFRLHA